MQRNGPGSPIAEIGAARRAFMAALRGGDGPAAASAYTDDARLMAPSAELLAGRQSIARFWQAGIDAGVDSIELDAVDLVIESDDTAHEIGRYVLRLTSPSGEAVVDRGRYMLVYRREADGAWRRAAETFSPGDVPSDDEPVPKSSPEAAFVEGARVQRKLHPPQCSFCREMPDRGVPGSQAVGRDG